MSDSTIILGTPGSDTINGSADADVIAAGRGNDVVSAGAGDDVIVSGSGSDAIDGGAGEDTLVLQGSLHRYTFTRNEDGSVTVDANGNSDVQGIKSVTNVEFVSSTSGETVDISTVAPCFALGTMIRTPGGLMAVEALVEGDLVTLATGEPARVIWVGRRTVDIERHRWPDLVRPVRIQAGALADGVPSRDLFLSPEHGLLIDGALVPAGSLVNGRTIVQEGGIRFVTYFHVELEAHDIILAEDTPVETYLDVGNRFMFEGGPVVVMDPRFDAPAGEVFAWCAPRIEGGEALAAIRTRLMARAEAFGFRATTASALHLSADGQVIAGRPLGDDIWRFELPAGVADLRIRSRTACPAADDGAWEGDRRQLGVAVRRIVIRGAAGQDVVVAMDDPSLSCGFHPVERQGDAPFRWTDGNALLPTSMIPVPEGPAVLEIQLCGTLRYWEPLAAERRAA